jgi:hypothetical protein
VPVDGRAVGVVVRLGAKLPDRVDADRGDEREDREANRRHEPEDEVVVVRLLGGLVGEPGDEVRDRGREEPHDDSDGDYPDYRSPAHYCGRGYSRSQPRNAEADVR